MTSLPERRGDFLKSLPLAIEMQEYLTAQDHIITSQSCKKGYGRIAPGFQYMKSGRVSLCFFAVLESSHLKRQLNHGRLYAI